MDRDKTAAYRFHGIEFPQDAGSEAIADFCPFCNKENHFFVNKETGQADCKHCHWSGNVYTFLHSFYEKNLKKTKETDYKRLSRQRDGLSVEALKESGLAYDRTNKRWLIPVYNKERSLVNLKVWLLVKGERKCVATSDCKLHLYNLDNVAKTGPIYICEGEFTAIALKHLLDKSKQKGSVVATGGASTFKVDWCEHFKGREVIIAFDNDTAGKNGTNRIVDLLRKHTKPRSISQVNWPDSYPTGYDARDVVCSQKKKSYKALFEFFESLISLSPEKKQPNKTTRKLPRIKTFKELVKAFHAVGEKDDGQVHMTEDMEIGLLLMLATTLSIRLPGDPIWLFIVGPPGSGKTLLLQSFKTSGECHYESSLTAHSLVSGYKTEDGHDPSIIPQVIAKTLVLKDYTEVTSLPISDQEIIYGILRGAYDGHVQKTYGHGIVRVYPEPDSEHDTCHFSMVAGVTNAIHGHNRASLGERFLKYQMVKHNSSHEDQLRAAIHNAMNHVVIENEVADLVTGFLDQEFDINKIPKPPKWFINQIVGLAQLAAYLRAVVERHGKELAYRPSPEVGTRLSKQLIKLAQSIAWVLKKRTIDQEIYSVIERVALDTVHGWSKDIIVELGKNPKGLDKMALVENCFMSATQVERTLNDLLELGCVSVTKPKTGERGAPSRVWKLSTELRSLWRLAKIKGDHIHYRGETHTYERVKNRVKKSIRKKKTSTTK